MASGEWKVARGLPDEQSFVPTKNGNYYALIMTK